MSSEFLIYSGCLADSWFKLGKVLALGRKSACMVFKALKGR